MELFKLIQLFAHLVEVVHRKVCVSVSLVTMVLIVKFIRVLVRYLQIHQSVLETARVCHRMLVDAILEELE